MSAIIVPFETRAQREERLHRELMAAYRAYQPVDEVVVPSRRWSQPVLKTIRAGPALFSTKTSRMVA
jgi:hypothetical protein